jgi:hypothetical protein
VAVGEVEDTALEGGSAEVEEAGSTAVSLAVDSSGRADLAVEGFLVGELMGASVIAVSVGAVFGTLMGASSALDILSFTRFIIPIITRILSTGLIWDTKMCSGQSSACGVG